MKRLFSLRVLYAFILISFLGSTVFLYFFTLVVDEKYSDLIETQTRVSEMTQKISKGSNKSYFILSEILHESRKDSIKSLEKTWRERRSKSNNLFDSLSKVAFFAESNKKDLDDLVACRKKYLDHCDSFFNAKNSANNPLAVSLFIDSISPSFVIYQNQLESFLKGNNKSLLEINGKITSDTKTKSFLYLILGLSPFALFGIFTLLSFLFMVIFFKIFFYREG